MTRGQTLQLFKSREDAKPVAAFNGLTRRTLAFTERIMLTEYELPAGKGADLHTHTVDEIAYLGLECERLGAAWVGPDLRGILCRRLGDHPHDLVVDFYAASRGCLRARLALAHRLEPEPRTPERWPMLARDYLDLAERAAARL